MPIALFWFTFWVVTFWVATLAGAKLYARPVSAVADGGGTSEGQKRYYVRDYIIMYYVSVYVIIYYIIAYVITIGTASTGDCVSPPAFCSTVLSFYPQKHCQKDKLRSCSLSLCLFVMTSHSVHLQKDHCVPFPLQEFPQFTRLPRELQSEVISWLPHTQLGQLCLVSKSFHSMGKEHLYSKIYLNDRVVEVSGVHDLAPSWTWFNLHGHNDADNRDNNNVDDATGVDTDASTLALANIKLQMLVRSLTENTSLCALVQHVRLNWDIDESLQVQFVELLSLYGSSLRFIENVTTMRMNNALLRGNHYTQLETLDVPPSTDSRGEINRQVSLGYIRDVVHVLNGRLTESVKHLTLFMDPVKMFNNLHRLKAPLELESIKIHLRLDIYPIMVFDPRTVTVRSLTNFFSTKTLKSLALISWDDQVFDQYEFINSSGMFQCWCPFENIEDLTFISMTFDDKGIAQLIRSIKRLKKIKLDYHRPDIHVKRDSEVYKSLWRHTSSLQFVDIKLELTDKLLHFDVREYSTLIDIPCTCPICSASAQILRELIPTETKDYTTFLDLNIFDRLLKSSVSPYSKSVDAYPSVNTGNDTMDSFLQSFNKKLGSKYRFAPQLTKPQFELLYTCLLHSMKIDLKPFIENFPNIHFLVISGISFVTRIQRDGCKGAFPLFFVDNYFSNFTKEWDELYCKRKHEKQSLM